MKGSFKLQEMLMSSKKIQVHMERQQHTMQTTYPCISMDFQLHFVIVENLGSPVREKAKQNEMKH